MNSLIDKEIVAKLQANKSNKIAKVKVIVYHDYTECKSMYRKISNWYSHFITVVMITENAYGILTIELPAVRGYYCMLSNQEYCIEFFLRQLHFRKTETFNLDSIFP